MQRQPCQTLTTLPSADIVNERRGITADTALRFARYFGNSPTFWMNLPTGYDLEVVEDEIARQVERDSNPWKKFAIRVPQSLFSVNSAPLPSGFSALNLCP